MTHGAHLVGAVPPQLRASAEEANTPKVDPAPTARAVPAAITRLRGGGEHRGTPRRCGSGTSSPQLRASAEEANTGP